MKNSIALNIVSRFALVAGLSLLGWNGSAMADPNVTTPGGTVNYMPKFKGTTSIGNSQIYDNGTNVGIGTSAPKTKLHLYNTTSHAELRAETTLADSNHVPAISVKNPSTEWSFGLTDGTGLNIRENSAAYASRMFIKNGGNVGIGTMAPAERLDVASGDSSYVRIDTAWGDLHYNGGKDGLFGLINEGPSTGATVINSTAGGALMTVRNTGNVGIGTTAPAYKLDVNGTVNSARMMNPSANRQSSLVKPLDNPVERIDCLEGVSYRAKNARADEDYQIGLVGEDVEACFPELVSTAPDGVKSIDYSRLVVPLIEASKDQQQSIRDLEAELAKTNARLARLEASLKGSR